MLKFDTSKPLTARAMYLGQRLDLRALEKTQPLETNPLTITAGNNGIVVLFRYGVTVFFGMHSSEIMSFINDIRTCIILPYAEPEAEDEELYVSTGEVEGIHNERIRLHGFDVQRLQIIADVLAKNVVLAHYETDLNYYIDEIEPLAAKLGKQHTIGKGSKELLRFIGDALLIEGKMIGRVEATEKPELIWDYPEYERLYMRLEDEYELSERQSALERKLSLISKTAETLLGILQNQRSLRVEWYIVILIVVEIVITLTEKLVH